MVGSGGVWQRGATMSIDVLAQVVADAFQFLELSDDEVVDPDAAVAQRKRQALAAATARLAAGQSDGRVRALLQELPAHLGLLDGDEQ